MSCSSFHTVCEIFIKTRSLRSSSSFMKFTTGLRQRSKKIDRSSSVWFEWLHDQYRYQWEPVIMYLSVHTLIQCEHGKWEPLSTNCFRRLNSRRLLPITELYFISYYRAELLPSIAPGFIWSVGVAVRFSVFSANRNADSVRLGKRGDPIPAKLFSDR